MRSPDDPRLQQLSCWPAATLLADGRGTENTDATRSRCLTSPPSVHMCHGNTNNSRVARRCTRVPGSSACRRRCPTCICCGCAPGRKLKWRPTQKGPPVQVKSHTYGLVTKFFSRRRVPLSGAKNKCMVVHVCWDTTRHPFLKLASPDWSGAVESSMESPEGGNIIISSGCVAVMMHCACCQSPAGLWPSKS